MTKIVFLSDTHGQHKKLSMPEGRIVVHCGDALNRGSLQEAVYFAEWFSELPYEHKIYVPGNHDASLEDDYVLEIFRKSGIYVLIDNRVMLDGIRFHGSPWTPIYGNWSFMDYDYRLKDRFNKIQEGCDVLITHGPPYSVLDTNTYGENCGSVSLFNIVNEVKPKIHVFGHIHEAWGKKQTADTLFMNVSILDRSYDVDRLREPVVLDYNSERKENA